MDEKIQEFAGLIKEYKAPSFHLDQEGIVWFKHRICIPNIQPIKNVILSEIHESPYSIHPRSTKMYQDLKERYWWYGMKRDIAEYMALCDTCQRVKAKHQRPARLLHPLKVPEWKWDEVGMDFIVGMLHTQKGYDSI